MVLEHNSGFHHALFSTSAFSGHTISFQPEAINSLDGIIRTSGMFCPNSYGARNACGVNTTGSSSIGDVYETAPGLKRFSPLAVDWSPEEQSVLEEGLVKYAVDSSFTRYIKIAALLNDKTVRDVALRCRWMIDSGKRCKLEDHLAMKRAKDKKGKLTESSLRTNLQSPAQLLDRAAISSSMHHGDPSNQLSVTSFIGHLFEDNVQLFDQIGANLAMFKAQENVELFCRARNNITAILNNLKDMPGMGQMPPLPVIMREELLHTILPVAVQVRPHWQLL